MKHLSILFCVLSISMLGFSADSSQYDGRYLLREVTYTLNSDGSWIRDYHHRMQYNSHNATRRMGETFVLFNPEFQKLEAIRSETIMADGTRVPLPKNAVNPVLPRAAHGFPGFSHLREMVITHTGLERGAVVDLSYRLVTKKDFQPGFAAREELTDHLPVDRLVIRVIAPSTHPIRFAASDHIQPRIEQDGGRRTWTWSLENLPPRYQEPDMPAEAPVLLLGERGDWKGICSILADPGELPQSMQPKLEKLKGASSDAVERLMAVERLVNESVDLCRVPLSLTGWRFRPLATVYRLHSGTALERALFYRAALKAAGVDAGLLLVPEENWLDGEGPVLPQIGSFLVELREAGKPCAYLNPSGHADSLFPYQLAGRSVYNVDKDRFERIFPPEAENVAEIRGNWEITDPEHTAGWLELTLSGGFVPYSALHENTFETAKGFLKHLLPVGKLELEGIRELSPRILRIRVRVESLQFRRLAPGLIALDPPRTQRLRASAFAFDSRHTPWTTPWPFRVSIHITLNTGKGMTLVPGTDPLDRQENGAAFRSSMQKMETGTWRANWELSIPARVAPADYPAFRSLVARALSLQPWFTLSVPGKD